MNRRRIGTAHEQEAADYLEQEGFRIIGRNFACRSGEIDIIARNRRVTAFVEVKRRTTERFGRPAEAVTGQKRRHILRTAQVYMQENGLEDAPVRFDIVEVTSSEIRHLEGAFDATDLA